MGVEESVDAELRRIGVDPVALEQRGRDFVSGIANAGDPMDRVLHRLDVLEGSLEQILRLMDKESE